MDTKRGLSLVPALECPNPTPEACLEQLVDEPDNWYQRYLLFVRLGVGRSIEETFRQEYARLYRKPKTRQYRRPNDHWLGRARQHRWYERAEAYDRAVYEQYEQRWRERQDQVRERGWNEAERTLTLAAQLRDKAAHLLDDRKLTYSARDIPPLANAAAKLLDISTKLARLSAGLETERRTIDVQALVEEIAATEDTPPEEVEALCREIEQHLLSVSKQ